MGIIINPIIFKNNFREFPGVKLHASKTIFAIEKMIISDVVINNETGLLIDEYDYNGMAKHMIGLAKKPEYAGNLGRRAVKRIKEHFELDLQIEILASILHNVSSS